MKTISITGLDGCGKSTQAQLLLNSLPNARIVSVWDIIKKEEFQSWTIYQNPTNVEKYVYNLHAFSRSLFIFHAFNEAYEKAMHSNADFLIFDGFWYKYWAIEEAMGAPKSFGKILSQQYQTPDFNVYLKLSIADLLIRKKEISVYEGGEESKNKLVVFKEIQTKAKAILENKLPANTSVIDGLLTPEQIHKLIRKELELTQ